VVRGRPLRAPVVVSSRSSGIPSNAPPSLPLTARKPAITSAFIVLIQKTLGINDFYFGSDDWDFPLGSMHMLGKSEKVLIGFDAPEAEDLADLATHAMDFWLTTEDLPLPGNRVTVDGDGQVSLRYQPTNLEAHQRLRGKFTDLLDSIQCRRDVLENYSYRGVAAGHQQRRASERHRTVRHGSALIRLGSELPAARGG
jgi:hypothetical protein